MSQKFQGRAVEMVVASKTIAESLRNYIDELSSVRTSWTPEYADDLHSRIDHIMENRLGVDPKREQRQSTDRIADLEVPALRDLLHLRRQLKVDFNGSELEEIFNTLGEENEFIYSRVLGRLRSSHKASEDQPETSQE